MRKLQILVVALLVFHGFEMSGQSSFFPFDEKNASIKDYSPIRLFNDRGVKGIDITFRFPGAFVKNIDGSGKEYKLLSVPDFSYLKEAGRPALPAHNELIAIPEGAAVSLRVTATKVKTFKDYLIYPALKPATDQYGAPEPEFEIDEEFYKTDIVFPDSPVKIIDTLIVKGIRMALVEICPVQYNPGKNELTVYSTISFSLDFSGGKGRFLNQNMYSEYFLNTFPNYVLNAESIRAENSINGSVIFKKVKGVNGPPVNYIIITHSNYLAAADSLAKWKSQLGYSVEIVSSSSWTAASVKSAVHQRYNNWNPKPDYFVIIGDHGDVPGEVLTSPATGDLYATDLYYACMDGTSDYMPDMARGRISVTSAADAMNVVMKIIRYERNPQMTAAFYKNGLNAAYFQDDDNNTYADRRFAQTSEDIRNYLTNSQGMNITRVYYTGSSKNPLYWNNGYYANGEPVPNDLKKPAFPWNGTRTHVNSAINSSDGQLYVFHRDHGYETGWGDPAYSNSDINSLNNSTRLPVVFSINCLTGKYYYSECFAEKFLRRAGGGAVGVFAHGEVSYSGYNDGLSLGLVDGIWASPGLIPNFTGNGDNPVGTPTAHAPIYHMGHLAIHGLVRMVQTWGNSKYTFELFNWFGDPAMRIWTSAPSAVTASHDISIDCGDNYFNIYSGSLSDGLATIVADGQLIGSVVLSGGTGVIDITGITGNEVLLTISKHNHIPYIAKINVNNTCAPVCDFTASVTATCTGVVQFTDNSVFMPNDWFWDFGDGNTSTLQNPLHIYSGNGVYTVKLVVSNAVGEDSLIKISYVSVGMPASPTVNGAAACYPTSLNLSASGVGNLLWYDNPLGGVPAGTGNNFTTPIINTSTTYYVQSEVVSPSYTYGGKPDNSGSGANFGSAFEHALIFNCTQPVMLQSVKVYAQSSGNRTIYLKNSSGTTLQSVTVNIPAGESRITLNFNVPVGNALRLAGPLSPNLFRNDGGISYPYNIGGIISITHSTATSNPTGYYYYFYDWETVQYDTCSSALVPVDAVIEPMNATAGPDISICSGGSANINASGGTSYLWSNGDTNSSITVSPSQNTTYIVTITDGQCSVIDSVNVIIDNSNQVILTTSGSPNICTGDTLTLTANSSMSYLWSPGGETTQSIEVTQGGTYYVMVSDGVCNGTSSPISVNVFNSQPLAAFTWNANIQEISFINTSDSSNAWYWDFGDGNFSYQQNPVHNYVSPGNYTVNLTAYNPCGSDITSSVIYVSAAGIDEYEAYNTLSLFPNPSAGKFNLSLYLEDNDQLILNIYSVTGQSVWNREFYAGKGEINLEIDILHAVKGSYFLSVKGYKGNSYRKILIY